MKPLVSSLLVFSMLAIFSQPAFADQFIDKERWGRITSDNKKEIIAYLQPRLQQYVNEHPRLK